VLTPPSWTAVRIKQKRKLSTATELLREAIRWNELQAGT